MKACVALQEFGGGTVEDEGSQGGWGHWGPLRVRDTMGAERHCGKFKDLQLARGLRERRPGPEAQERERT